MLIEFPVTIMESEDLITTNERLFKVTSDPFKTILSNRFMKTNAASKNMAKALNKNNKSGFTPLLGAADNVRDDGFRCIKFGVLSATFNKDSAIKEAGKRLLTVLKSHNTTLYSLSYVSQTAEMKSLKLDLDEMTDDLATVGLTQEYQDMIDAMDTFETLFSEKTKEESNKNLPLVIESKKELSKQLILLLRQVQIMEDDETEGIDELINIFNKTLTTVLSAVRARKTRVQNSTSSDDETVNS